MATYELLTIRETLELKLSIWQTRAQHAKGKRRTECEHAIADLKAKIAAL